MRMKRTRKDWDDAADGSSHVLFISDRSNIMDEATKKHVKELVAMPFRTFLDVCVAWKEEAGEDFSEVAQTLCPVHQYAMQKGRCLDVTGHTELCPVCEKPMCPTCGSHCVDQISRVTGYMQVVSGWNAAKKQEYEDRHRYSIPGAEMQ